MGRGEEGRGKDRFKIRGLSAHERYSQEILEFLASMDVGRRIPVAENDAQSEGA